MGRRRRTVGLFVDKGRAILEAFMQNKANFRNAQMNVTSLGQKAYDDLSALRLPKNKANSKPNKANFRNALARKGV